MSVQVAHRASLSVLAPAKVNLALHVTARRPDGYHSLESVVAFAAHGDRIDIARAEDDRFTVSGPFAAGVPTGDTNLVVKARDALQPHCPSAFPVAIHLTKTLPPASGVGGGSSDAAATLRALRNLWKADLDDDALAAIALPLGADVPMCLSGRPLVARGIGDYIEPLVDFPTFATVLVNPGVPVSTPEIFRLIRTPDNPPLPALPKARDAAGLIAWLAKTRNDLEAPALNVAPEIADAVRALADQDALLARMSGSGATCFGLFRSTGEAMAAAGRIAGDHPGWYVQSTRLGGSPS